MDRASYLEDAVLNTTYTGRSDMRVTESDINAMLRQRKKQRELERAQPFRHPLSDTLKVGIFCTVRGYGICGIEL